MATNRIEIAKMTLLSEKQKLGGQQRLFKFDNGYGASVVIGPYSYGGSDGLYELAILKFTGKNEFHLCYTTEITDDVIGWLSEEGVQNLLTQIEAL